MSTFDINNFAQTQFTEANSTQTAPLPDGDYTAVILGPINEKGKSGFRQAKDRLLFDVIWSIDDEAAKEATGLSNPTARQTLFLDVNAQNGLDFGKGKNVGLGRLREALGQNNNGMPWQFSDLVGAVAKIKTQQRVVKNDDGTESVFVDVKAVTKV